jgi:hypothetical protein
MRDLVLLSLGHLRIRPSFVFEASVPSCHSKSASTSVVALRPTLHEIRSPKSVGPRHATIMPYNPESHQRRSSSDALPRHPPRSVLETQSAPCPVLRSTKRCRLPAQTYPRTPRAACGILARPEPGGTISWARNVSCQVPITQTRLSFLCSAIHSNGGLGRGGGQTYT